MCNGAVVGHCTLHHKHPCDSITAETAYASCLLAVIIHNIKVIE